MGHKETLGDTNCIIEGCLFGAVVLLRCSANVLGDGAPSSLADRCHSLGLLPLPPAALPSLPRLSPTVRVRPAKKKADTTQFDTMQR